ncbi:MAG: glycosyltransferase [Patescibacteria group bacterium]
MPEVIFFLSHWDEGCPLGPLEAMACGTPIANRRSSLPEIVKDGQTGFIVEENDLGAAVDAVKKIDTISRRNCRQWIEENFSAELMAQNYERAYKEL